jgi:predicted nuclease of restriction endonuclease-like (RecB) superfamily
MKPAVTLDQVYGQIKDILTTARSQAFRAVNFAMVQAYWEIGRVIVEEEQQGKAKAGYGEYLIQELSSRMTKELGRGFDRRNLWFMRSFYLTFEIVNAARSLSSPDQLSHAVRDELPVIRPELSWTHYRHLLKVERPEVRRFYLEECIAANWSTRQLERQVNSHYYERLLASRDREPVRAEIQQLESGPTPTDIIKDPYVLEFLGMSDVPSFREKELEGALIGKLQEFLLELGRGFSFVARQKRFTVDGQHFFIDLVFYNYILKCFVLIDLKVSALTHQDLGQMQMYVNYYTRELMNEGDSPPIGIVLCADKSDALARYTLPEGNTQIFASRYKLYLPTEEELAAELKRERRAIEMERRLAGIGDE